jgi:hypothetical protein
VVSLIIRPVKTGRSHGSASLPERAMFISIDSGRRRRARADEPRTWR